jgi:tetratricopeptide (TPR) repeat protein
MTIPYRSMLLVAVSCAVVVLRLAAQESGLRTWTDKTGSKRLEAELQSASPQSVSLKGSEGTTFEIAVSNLSEGDLTYLRERFPELYQQPSKGFTTAAALQTAAKKRRYAADALAMYEAFFADPAVAAAEKAQAKAAHPQWQAMAQAKKVRVGPNWLAPAEYAELMRKEKTLLEKADQLLPASDLEAVVKALKDAVRTNPAGIGGSFRLGLLEALHPEGHSAERAKSYFNSCKRCLTEYLQDLTAAERGDLAACENNLGLACIRLGQLAEALNHFEQCVKAASLPAAVVHNLAHLKAETERDNGPRVVVSSSEAFRLNRLLDQLQITANSRNPGHGWQFIPLASLTGFNPKGKNNSGTSERNYYDPWCMACDGLSTLKCPNHCDLGTLMQVRYDSIALSNGMKAVQKTPYRVRCPVCGGKGRVDCRFCNQGYDSRFPR